MRLCVFMVFVFRLCTGVLELGMVSGFPSVDISLSVFSGNTIA